MNNITYDYYRIFYYVGKYGSFTKAAQILKNSQPNITRAMNNLESQLGVTLFIRNKRGALLTAEGERLFSRVSIAYEQLQIAEAEIEASRINDAGMVAIGISDIAMYEVLYPILPQFREEHPSIDIHISNESTSSAIKRLKDGLIDFAIVTTPISEDTFYKAETIKEFREYAVVSKDFGKDIKKRISFRELCSYPLIMLASGTATRQFYDALFLEHKVELTPQMSAGNVNQVISMARAGLGVGFVPESILKIDDAFIKLELEDAIPPRKICVVRDNHRVMSNAAKTLFEYIYNCNHI